MRLTDGIRNDRVRAVDLNFTVVQVIGALNDTEWYRQGIQLRTDETRNRVYCFTLRMESSASRGAAVTWSGRRSIYACWHTHRDVIAGLFAMRPAARLVAGARKNGLRYDGMYGFQRLFPETYYDQVGSLDRPATRGCLCACDMGARVYHPSVREALEKLGASL